MEAVPSDHKYENLTPTKFSKGQTPRRRSMVLIIGGSIIVVAILVILATVVASLASNDFRDISDIKEIANASMLCESLNSANTCYAAHNMTMDDCKSLNCTEYYMTVKFVNNKLESDVHRGLRLLDKDTDGIPCGKAKICFKKKCTEITNEKLIKQIELMSKSRSNGGMELQSYLSHQCFRQKFAPKIKQKFEEAVSNRKCNEITKTAVSMRLRIKTGMHGIGDPWSETTKPFSFVNVGDCGEKEITVDEFRKKICNDSSLLNPCEIECPGEKTTLVSKPYKCKRVTDKGDLYGYCFLGTCIYS